MDQQRRRLEALEQQSRRELGGSSGPDPCGADPALFVAKLGFTEIRTEAANTSIKQIPVMDWRDPAATTAAA